MDRLRNMSSMCDFLEEIACHKTFSAHFLRKSLATNFFSSFPQEIGRHKTFSAHFLRKSPATKLFRLISSGNRPPQTFSAHFLRKSLGWASTHFLEEIVGWPTSNSRYVKRTLYRLKQPLHSRSLTIDRQNGITPPGRSVEKLRH